jgi:hypothetical protein
MFFKHLACDVVLIAVASKHSEHLWSFSARRLCPPGFFTFGYDSEEIRESCVAVRNSINPFNATILGNL